MASLTAADLATFPVWRSHGGPDSTALVSPSERKALSESERETFIALTEFTLADGTQLSGYCSPVDDSGIDYIQPVIILPSGGPFRFWFDEQPAQEVLAAQWCGLGKKPEAVFPVRYRCLVPVDGRTVTGELTKIGGPL